jgi:hypothetical protein
MGFTDKVEVNGKFFGNCPRREAGLWGLSAVIPVLWMFTVLVGYFIVGI